MSPSLSLLLSPNLVLNDPFPLFSQPIFYRLDHAQYGGLFMQMSAGSHGGKCEQSETECLLQHTVGKTCQSNKEPRNKREHASLDLFPAYFLPAQLRQIWHFVTTVSCKSQKKYHVFNSTATQQKIGPGYDWSSPCIPGSLTVVTLAYSRSPCTTTV